MPTIAQEHKFFNGAVEAMLKTEDDSAESGSSLYDEGFREDDIAEQDITRLQEECRRFMENAERRGYFDNASDYYQAGIDFILTRNEHGTGFWDRPKEYGTEAATRLTEMCEDFGSIDAFVDDGTIYLE